MLPNCRLSQKRRRRRSPAPIDPDTGKCTPHFIPVGGLTENGKTDWVGWGMRLSAALKGALSVGQVDEWLKINEPQMKNCALASEKMAARLYAIAKEVKATHQVATMITP